MKHTTILFVPCKDRKGLSAAIATPSGSSIFHHSFLPAFVGAKPHRQAHQRGVKLIGATAHYGTEALDDGTIIEQGVARIAHKDALEDLVAKGRESGQGRSIASGSLAHREPDPAL